MKRLVLCCDGTWNRADQESDGEPCPTNVVKLAFRIAKRHGDGSPQVIYYDHGVGTGNALDRLAGGAFGAGLEENIHDAYRFLVANYEPGDRIYLFGFSRGAFTVRSIAGMVRNCGILKRSSVRHYAGAVALYADARRRPDHPDSERFRAAHCVSGLDRLPIHFIGVWDTVGALGVPVRGLDRLSRPRHEFHDTELSGSVRHACHALAIDERRRPFTPTLWYQKPKPGQTVEQVWFPGVHSDVGGGYPDSGLSDIALAWMLDRAAAIGDLAIDSFPGLPVRPRSTAPMHDSRTGLFRLTPGADRTIGLGVDMDGRVTDQPDPTQSVHDSARERWRLDADYRPPALRDYFRRTGDPLAAS